MRILTAVATLLVSFWLLNHISYRVLKRRTLARRVWDLNVCCGKTDGGGVNADIVRHAPVPRFVQVDVHALPFRAGQFQEVLCSHTIEHVEDPDGLMSELQRVGGRVTLVIPPLWDITAALNVLEHRWLFLTWRKEHSTLPARVRLPLSRTVQKMFGQRLHA